MPRHSLKKMNSNNFPNVKIVSRSGGNISINKMEWKTDGQLILTVEGLPKILSNLELWDFTTGVSYDYNMLKKALQSLAKLSISDLVWNIENLERFTRKRSDIIEDWRKRLLPENYPGN